MYLLIFVCTGTQIFSFNRLLKEIDFLIEKKIIKQEVFAQIGYSNYQPQYYSYKSFLTPREYDEQVNKSDLIITHGGTGAIIKALKLKKQVIAVPRQAKYKEHEDNHQFEIVNFFSENGYLLKVEDIRELQTKIEQIKEYPIKKIFKGKGNIVGIIEQFINL